MHKAKSEEVSDFQWIMTEMRRLHDAGEFTYQRVLAILKPMAGRRIWLSRSLLVRPDQVKVARALLDVGASVAQIRDRLVDGGYVPSRDVAYFVIHEAVDKRGKAAPPPRIIPTAAA